MKNRYRKVSLVASLVAMVMGLAILGYFGYNKISRELYKKYLLENNIVFEIPDLYIKAPVLEGTDNKALQYAAGHFEDTDALNQGNYCICGHSSTIYAIKVINPDGTEVLQDYGDNRLTVLACTDDGTQWQVVVGIFDPS